MKFLQRPAPPAALGQYNHSTHEWSRTSPNSTARDQIWASFQGMQNGFCCYCESIAEKGNGHIEHFLHKGRKPDGSRPYKHLMFNWDNLVGSCGFHSGNSCGHYKDRQGSSGPGPYEPQDLIKPDRDNPSNFFKFLSTGKITIKSGLSQRNAERAKETIRVLNLSSMKAARKRQIDIFKREINTAIELVDNDQQLAQELQRIRQKIRNHEFQTAVLDTVL